MNTEPGKCYYCGKPIEKPVTKKIFDRVRDEYTGKQKVRERNLTFCSSECGTHCQYAHEG